MSSKKPIIDIDPSTIRFTHCRIRPFFTGNNFRIETTINDIVEQRTSVSDLPLITVIENGGHYFSLNNRRLYVMKYLHSNGHLASSNNTIKVYSKKALDREKKRYTPGNCSLEATIMKEHHKEEGGQEDQDSDNETAGDGVSEATDKIVFEKIAVNSEQSSKEKSKVVSSNEDTKADDSNKRRNQKSASSNSKTTNANAPNINAKVIVNIKRGSNIDKKVLDGMKGLQKLFVKNKLKPVLSQLEEWVLSGQLCEGDDLNYIRMQIGFET